MCLKSTLYILLLNIQKFCDEVYESHAKLGSWRTFGHLFQITLKNKTNSPPAQTIAPIVPVYLVVCKPIQVPAYFMLSLMLTITSYGNADVYIIFFYKQTGYKLYNIYIQKL